MLRGISPKRNSQRRVTNEYNGTGFLTKLERGGYNTNEPNGNAVYQRYNFTYNDFGDTTKITLGSNHEYTLAKYTFAERGGLLKKLEYGNGHAVSYTYDNYGRQHREPSPVLTAAGKIIISSLSDPKLPSGTVKFSQVVKWTGGLAEIHYLFHEAYGYFDFKFK